MTRIADLPLNEQFLKVDSMNMAIPIILNRATSIDLRIKAANQSFENDFISIESLAALYQSVDFDSSQLNNPEETILELSGNVDLLMAYYFQLVNIQIFPSERLESLIEFWNFAKIHKLENIAYSLSYKIIDSIEISSDYLRYATKISTSYIYNNDFEKALNWITFYENANGVDDKSTLVRILLSLYSTNEVESIISIINENFEKLTDVKNKNSEELIFILFDTLQNDNTHQLKQNFSNIFDDRSMPSVFISENIKDAINNKNDDKFLIYSIISINNKEWEEINPHHLRILLKGYFGYNNTNLIRNLVLEIFKNYNIL